MRTLFALAITLIPTFASAAPITLTFATRP